MATRARVGDPEFGGLWTEQKLAILEDYLRAFCKVFKNQPWYRLIYLDAFAGTGRIIPDSANDAGASPHDRGDFIMGSVERALRVEDRAFDRLVFVEKDRVRFRHLENLCRDHRDPRIKVINRDANKLLRSLSRDTFVGGRRYLPVRDWRGVLFVDPFGAQLDWATVEHIARLERLDMWLLFPVSVIRMLPLTKGPDKVTSKWVDRLNTVFGGDHWKTLYSTAPQHHLCGEEVIERERGVDGLLRIYKDQLRRAFGPRLLDESRTLRNSRNSPLFEFVFCVGSPSPGAIRRAKDIARHLIRNISKPTSSSDAGRWPKSRG